MINTWHILVLSTLLICFVTVPVFTNDVFGEKSCHPIYGCTFSNEPIVIFTTQEPNYFLGDTVEIKIIIDPDRHTEAQQVQITIWGNERTKKTVTVSPDEPYIFKYSIGKKYLTGDYKVFARVPDEHGQCCQNAETHFLVASSTDELKSLQDERTESQKPQPECVEYGPDLMGGNSLCVRYEGQDEASKGATFNIGGVQMYKNPVTGTYYETDDAYFYRVFLPIIQFFIILIIVIVIIVAVIWKVKSRKKHLTKNS